MKNLALVSWAALFFWAATFSSPTAHASPSGGCHMTTRFPDHAAFEETCQYSIVLPGQDPNSPKGWMKFLDFNGKAQIFSLNFFPPKDVKTHTPYVVTTDNTDSFLNGVVQPAELHEQCRMTRKFPTSGSVTFSAVGASSSDFHGTVVVYPACYVNFGTPAQTLVPANQQSGVSTTIVF